MDKNKKDINHSTVQLKQHRKVKAEHYEPQHIQGSDFRWKGKNDPA